MARRSAEWRSVARWLTIPLASLCLIAQVGSATHFVLVRHRICPEHGEVVDAARAGGQPQGLESSESTSAEAPDESWGPHGHDHCLFAVERRDEMCSASDAERTLLAPETRTAPPATAALVPAGIALYLIAPKSSPPA